jgi:2,3-bisphosphoglycerate-dependent phosphoglycerate mutase
VLVRHGQSIWNVENLFTGWTDVDLSAVGCEEARQAGRELAREGIQPQVVFTSVLKRAIRTQWLMLDELDLLWLPVARSWRLNERHYGALQRHPRFDRRYAEVAASDLPATESLKDTLARVLPYWQQCIVPELKLGRQVLVVAHGNSLRALVKMLDGLSEQAVVELNIPTGVPLLYQFDDTLRPLASRYLGDAEAIRAAAEAVRRQADKPR